MLYRIHSSLGYVFTVLHTRVGCSIMETVRESLISPIAECYLISPQANRAPLLSTHNAKLAGIFFFIQQKKHACYFVY